MKFWISTFEAQKTTVLSENRHAYTIWQNRLVLLKIANENWKRVLIRKIEKMIKERGVEIILKNIKFDSQNGYKQS